MLESPFLEQVHVCKGKMKKLRKKIYKFNISKHSRYPQQESTIGDALSVLKGRNIPQFLQAELQKYSGMTFSSLCGFSLREVKPLSEISQMTQMQEQQILDMYQKNKKTLKKRRTLRPSLKLDKRSTETSKNQQNQLSSSNQHNSLDSDQNNDSSSSESSSNESEQLFGVVGSSNQLDQDYHNSDAMFQSTMLDFQNGIQMDSEEFLFRY